MSDSLHSKWMKVALDEAIKAYDKEEIPSWLRITDLDTQCCDITQTYEILDKNGNNHPNLDKI